MGQSEDVHNPISFMTITSRIYFYASIADHLLLFFWQSEVNPSLSGASFCVYREDPIPTRQQYWRVEDLINVVEYFVGYLGADLQLLFSSWVHEDFREDPL